MMVLTTSRSSAQPSSSLQHPHSQHAKSSTVSPTRAAVSVGYSMSSSARLRSPAMQDKVRSSSPNYFGLVVSSEDDPGDSGVGPKDNWSPPTSSIRSFDPQSPKNIPLDANPEFEAFRKQSESKNTFSLGHANLSQFSSTRAPLSPRSKADQSTGVSDIRAKASASASTSRASIDGPTDAPENMPLFFGLPRQESPLSNGASVQVPSVGRSPLYHLDGRHPRLSLPPNKADPPSPQLRHHEVHHRAETLPPKLEEGPNMITCSQLKEMLDGRLATQLLLLDLRVAPQYSHYRIRGALNLCIPTTLLKRPSFNLAKLTETFKVDAEKAQFSTWKERQFIIVYDVRSMEKKDATSAVNTLKKFTDEGWKGRPCILRGGIEEFSRLYRTMIDHRSNSEVQSVPSSLSFASGTSVIAPVAGGCEMPGSKDGANPFFNNIRQNMDLVGGVGQIDVRRPDETRVQDDTFLPEWLQKAIAPGDHGGAVAARFLQIEQDELSRMQQALSSRVSYGTPVADPEKRVQIAGFEKGVKNRYNNIWPFEHARVRLQGIPEGSCDYINASHIKASWSNKRYIASQGPLPTTFEDFWSVVWDQDVRVIVMVTAESEGGQVKCHPYWKFKEYGNLRLKALSEKKVSLDMQKRHRPTAKQDTGRRRANTNSESAAAPISTNEPYVLVRKFTLSHSSEPFTPMREITQLHYSAWPDFGAPAQPMHLLALIELCNTMQRAALSTISGPHGKAEDPEDSLRTKPVLVHCSAGCGRTGTFCTVDSVIDMLKRQRREHRSGVTPMEFTKDGSSDYLTERKKLGNEDGDWIFSDENDLVQKTVEDFRKQRISMVQSLKQYVLCYETVWEWISQQQTGGRRERSGSESRSAGSRSS